MRIPHDTVAPDLLPHPIRLRVVFPSLVRDLKELMGSEWKAVESAMRQRELSLPEIIRRLSLPGVAPRFTELVLAASEMPGATARGGAVGIAAYLRQEIDPAPHFVLTNELVEMLEHTDIAPDVPVSMFQPPFSRVYIEFGRSRKIETIVPNASSGNHVLEGAYIERGHHVDGDVLYLVLTGSPVGKSGPQDDATLSFSLPLYQPDRSVDQVIRDAFEGGIARAQAFGYRGTPSEWSDHTLRAVLLIAKALLYIGMPETRRVMRLERTEGLKSVAGLKSPAKRAKAARRLERLYDYIEISPQPEHRQPTSSSQDGADRTVRAHWRRGHYRMQAHGAQMSLRKLIFVQPALVGGRGGDTPAPKAQYVVR